jgi:hypothetical protein
LGVCFTSSHQYLITNYQLLIPNLLQARGHGFFSSFFGAAALSAGGTIEWTARLRQNWELGIYNWRLLRQLASVPNY